jgi:hypothetical protein
MRSHPPLREQEGKNQQEGMQGTSHVDHSNGFLPLQKPARATMGLDSCMVFLHSGLS